MISSSSACTWVERAFRVYDNNRAGLAQAEAAGLDDPDFFFQAQRSKLLVEPVNQFDGTRGCAPRAAADQYMGTNDIHDSSLGLAVIGSADGIFSYRAAVDHMLGNDAARLVLGEVDVGDLLLAG